jgi:hypothetical protein
VNKGNDGSEGKDGFRIPEAAAVPMSSLTRMPPQQLPQSEVSAHVTSVLRITLLIEFRSYEHRYLEGFRSVPRTSLR